MIEQPPDQELDAVDFHATTNRQGDNPPTLLLVIDIQHTETSNTWRQQLSFTREKWVALMQLLDYAAENEGVAWKQ